MTTVSTPHSVTQSTSRCRSAVKVPKLRTGSGARSALTAAMCMVAPMSMAAAFGCTMGIVRSTLDFDLLLFLSNPPADMRKGWAAQFIQIPKRDRRDGVTTLKYATAHGPGFLTGSHATKIISAAPFRPQCSDKCVSIPQGASSAEISFLMESVAPARYLRITGRTQHGQSMRPSLDLENHMALLQRTFWERSHAA